MLFQSVEKRFSYKHKPTLAPAYCTHIETETGGCIRVDISGIKMLYLQITVIALHFSCLQPHFVEQYWVTIHESISGVGNLLTNMNDTSMI